jgi:hypothetical protein
MAAVGFTPIQLYYSTTSGASGVPTAGNLTNGELAINITDGKLFYKDNLGAIQVIGTKGGVGTSTSTQVLYNASGLVVGSANLLFDGTTLTAAGLAGPHNGTVGATTPSTGAFTTLSASSTVSGTGFSTYLASPPAIGGTAPAAGTFTTVKAIAAATQDAVNLQGRAGGSSSYVATITPTTLTASRTVTLPNADINFATGLPIANGGTGQTTAAAAFNALSPITSTGDLIIGNGANSATRLAIGTNGYVLTSNGTTASWAASTGGVTSFQTSLSGLTPNTGTGGAVTLAGTLGATSGGTTQSTYITGDILYSSATNTLSKLGIGSTGQVLTVSAGGVPTWSAAAGAGVTTISFGSTGLTPNTATAGAVTVAGTLATASGGTGLSGATPFTSGGVLYASSQSALASSALLASNAMVVGGGAGSAPLTRSNITSDNSFLQLGAATPLRFADSDSSNYVSFQAPATVATNVAWTLPATDGGSGQFLSTNGSGTLSWATASGGGTPGGSSGNLQYNNGSGGFAGSANLTWDNTNGLLGIGGTPTASKGTLQVGTIGYTDTGMIAGFASSTAGYNQIVLQNTSSNAAASTNFNVSNDAGTASTNFGEFGINSSGFTGTGSFSTAGYVYLAAASTDLAIGTYGSNKIHFVVNSGATDAAVFDTSGNFGIGQATPGSKLDVKGTLRLSGSSSGYVGLSPAAAAGSTTYVLPAADGTSGQFLKTDGSANLSWATASGGSSGPILESQIVISQNYTLTSNTNGFSVGPVSVATGYAVTVPTGQTWVVAVY